MDGELYEALLDVEQGGCYCTECFRPIEGGDEVLFLYFGLCGNCVIYLNTAEV